MKPKHAIRTSIALLLVLGMAFATAANSGASNAALSDAAWAKQICQVMPADELQRTYDGLRADRSGDVQFFAKDPDFVGSGLPHVGPWDYVQKVPMIWYGPGYINKGKVVNRNVTVADIAPTQADLFKTDFPTATGVPMGEALVPGEQRKDPPKLVMTVVWDSAGENVLEEWPNDWSYLKKLAKEGTSYSNAYIGLSPTSTAQGHATMGTGAMPIDHALIAHHFRIGNYMTTPWSQGSRLLDLPTFGDIYDLSTGNKALIGAVGTVPIHLGAVSHGLTWGGGDRDPIVLSDVNENAGTVGAEGVNWGLPKAVGDDYSFPDWINKADGTSNIPGLQEAIDMVDRMDGKADGKWRAKSIADLKDGFDTPARIPWENNLVMEFIKRENFGKDDVGDLMFANYKIIDYVGHVMSMNSPYMKDSLKVQDAALEELVKFLDKEVGNDNYVLLVTADHGAMPSPKATGAFVASPGKIGVAIKNEFGTDSLMLTQNTSVFLDLEALKKNGHTVDEVARFVGNLTKGQTYLEGYAPTGSEADEKLVTAAFPSSLLNQMPCVKKEPANPGADAAKETEPVGTN
ncbi:MAG: alkaline phosphatase family protein [Actinobacteria bacterium]|nr:alkaline phosphatase family protein [Actinomycetota bacterium]